MRPAATSAPVPLCFPSSYPEACFGSPGSCLWRPRYTLPVPPRTRTVPAIIDTNRLPVRLGVRNLRYKPVAPSTWRLGEEPAAGRSPSATGLRFSLSLDRRRGYQLWHCHRCGSAAVARRKRGSAGSPMKKDTTRAFVSLAGPPSTALPLQTASTRYGLSGQPV